MNRFLQRLNLAGILALALLCILQWHANRRANLAAIDLEKSAQKESAQLAEKDKALQGTIADLEDFRQRFTAADASLKEAQDKLKAADLAHARLADERDQLAAKAGALQTALGQWTAAVAARDEALRKMEDQLQKAVADRNEAVRKFNDLAAQFNSEVGQVKQANGTIEKLTAERNDAVARFNDLANKYNAIAKGLTTTTKP